MNLTRLKAEIFGEEKKDDIGRKYEALFSGPIGQAVLADILQDLGVCIDLDPADPVSNGLRNYAETSLRRKVGNLNYTEALRILLDANTRR